MGFRKERNLIERIADKWNLESAADEAISILDDKKAWFVKDFLKDREGNLKNIQRMILTGEFPEKEYKPVNIMSEEKEREINPLHFYPWSILFHAIKNVLQPIVERVMIADTSAGICERGQHYAALRTEMMIRRYRKYSFITWSDGRKFYQSLIHDVVIDALRWLIDDERFIQMIRVTLLDYRSGIEPVLLEEDQRKRRLCDWASDVPLRREPIERGITIGCCLSQLIGNLVMCRVDHRMKEVHRVKVYHRHCDDSMMGGRSLEEARENLRILDGECNRIGVCLKAISFYAPLKDESKYIDGRALDFVGFVYSRENMKVRKRTKKKFARKMKKVRSRKRRQQIKAAYWGIMKWGRCRNLWKKLTNNDMSFEAKGIVTERISYDDQGKRIFNVPMTETKKIRDEKIWIIDFEDGLSILDKKENKVKTGRCAVLYREDGSDEERKFVTSSKLIIDKLRKARDMEKNGAKIFPCDTVIHKVESENGYPTWDIE